MKEGVDYYNENGYRVFTATYHLKRGRCCQSGCRHCPWKSKKLMNTSNMVFLDMDGVLADFEKLMIERFPQVADMVPHSEEVGPYSDICQATPGFYRDLPPVEGAIDAFHALREKYDVWILSAPSWENPASYSEKREWCREWLGDENIYKKLILSNDKSFFSGRALVDDRTKYGAAEFKGEHIHFGTDKFPDWKAVTDYLL